MSLVTSTFKDSGKPPKFKWQTIFIPGNVDNPSAKVDKKKTVTDVVKESLPGLVLSGWTWYFDPASKNEYMFQVGDPNLLPPNKAADVYLSSLMSRHVEGMRGIVVVVEGED